MIRRDYNTDARASGSRQSTVQGQPENKRVVEGSTERTNQSVQPANQCIINPSITIHDNEEARLRVILDEQERRFARERDADRRAHEEDMRRMAEMIESLHRHSEVTTSAQGSLQANIGRTDRRRINVSSLEQLQGGTTLRDFVTWRSKWDDLFTLEHLGEFPILEQVAALCQLQKFKAD